MLGTEIRVSGLSSTQVSMFCLSVFQSYLQHTCYIHVLFSLFLQEKSCFHWNYVCETEPSSDTESDQTITPACRTSKRAVRHLLPLEIEARVKTFKNIYINQKQTKMFWGPTGGGKVGGELRRGGQGAVRNGYKKTPLIPSEFPSASVCR